MICTNTLILRILFSGSLDDYKKSRVSERKKKIRKIIMLQGFVRGFVVCYHNKF